MFLSPSYVRSCFSRVLTISGFGRVVAATPVMRCCDMPELRFLKGSQNHGEDRTRAQPTKDTALHYNSSHNKSSTFFEQVPFQRQQVFTHREVLRFGRNVQQKTFEQKYENTHSRSVGPCMQETQLPFGSSVSRSHRDRYRYQLTYGSRFHRCKSHK